MKLTTFSPVDKGPPLISAHHNGALPIQLMVAHEGMLSDSKIVIFCSRLVMVSMRKAVGRRAAVKRKIGSYL